MAVGSTSPGASKTEQLTAPAAVEAGEPEGGEVAVGAGVVGFVGACGGEGGGSRGVEALWGM